MAHSYRPPKHLREFAARDSQPPMPPSQFPYTTVSPEYFKPSSDIWGSFTVHASNPYSKIGTFTSIDAPASSNYKSHFTAFFNSPAYMDSVSSSASSNFAVSSEATAEVIHRSAPTPFDLLAATGASNNDEDSSSSSSKLTTARVAPFIGAIITLSDHAADLTFRADHAYSCIPQQRRRDEPPTAGSPEYQVMRRMFKNHQHEALSAWSEVKLGLKGLRKMEKVLLEAKSGRDGEPDNDDTAETLNGRLLKDEVTDFIGILEHKIVAFEAVMETWEL